MPQYSYEQHIAQAKQNNNTNLGPQVHFLSEYLKNDNDVVVVRFPYRSMADVYYVPTHLVQMPGSPYGKRVRCTGDANCELCAAGIPVQERVFVKMLAYVTNENTGAVEAQNVVWDRPSAFGDITLKGLIDDYGDLRQHLFKLKRSGSGNQTRYTPNIILNTAVYNPNMYKADFTELDQIDASKILSKSITQYREAMNPKASEVKQEVNEQVITNTPVQQSYAAQVENVTPQAPQTGYATPTQPAYENVNTGNPYNAAYANPAVQPASQMQNTVTPAVQPQPAAEAPATSAPRTGRYKF